MHSLKVRVACGSFRAGLQELYVRTVMLMISTAMAHLAILLLGQSSTGLAWDWSSANVHCVVSLMTGWAPPVGCSAHQPGQLLCPAFAGLMVVYSTASGHPSVCATILVICLAGQDASEVCAVCNDVQPKKASRINHLKKRRLGKYA